MTTTRPTKEFKTTGGHTFVLYEYITGREKREIESIIFDKADVQGAKSAEDIKLNGISKAIHDMKDKAIQIVVKEVKPVNTTETLNSAAPILQFILDLPEIEYSEVIKAIEEITEPKKD